MKLNVRDRSVLQREKGQVYIELGDPNSLKHYDRIAIVAQYSADAIQSKSLSRYLDALVKAGFGCILVSACEASSPLCFPHSVPEECVVMRRPNIGYDFGSWASALDRFSWVRSKSNVLLTNDSLVGPFADITFLLDWACEAGPDIRGMVSSFQFIKHIQSFFVCFRGGILDDLVWRNFFSNIVEMPTKMQVVAKYELGLSKTASRWGYSLEEFICVSDLSANILNPTMDGWLDLLDAGIPFVKRTVLTDPSTRDQFSEVERVISQRFFADIAQW